MKAMAERFDFDTMLIALNHQQKGREKFEEEAVPAAAQKGMGVMVMKVIRPRETVQSITPAELIQHALSLPQVHGAVIGTNSLEVLANNRALLQRFKTLPDKEMKRIRMALQPFYRNPHLEWMQPDYRDGEWV